MADGGRTDAGKTDGGVPEESPRDGAAGLAVACLSAFAAEAGLMLALVDGVSPGGWIGWGVGHAAVVAALAVWTLNRRRRRVDERFAGLLAIGTAFLGPSGPLCVGLSVAAHAVFRRYATGFHDWYLSLFPESENDPAQELYELIVTGRERAGAAAVDSFTDVMTVGSPQQKQAVIALVSRHFRPSFTPALKLGLADSDPSVRVQAATATARVEHEFNERWQKLERVADGAPESAAARHALARHLDDYAFCGLLDANREQELRRKALEHYRAALEIATQVGDRFLTIGDRLNIGLVLARVGDAVEGEGLLRQVLDDRVRGNLIDGNIVWTLWGLALAAARRGDLERAARLYGGAVRLSESVGFPVAPADRAAFEADIDATRATLGESAFAAARADGAALPHPALFALALDE